MKVVHIEWLDASAINSWTDLNEVPAGATLTHTVGFVIHESDELITIASTLDPHTNSANALMQIPLCCIKEARTICQIKTT